jgi:hypothetical protein
MEKYTDGVYGYQPHSMKRISLLLLLSLFLLQLACTTGDASAPPDRKATGAGIQYERIKKHALAARLFCQQNGLDRKLCILADMQVHSGKNRMVVWDFTKDTVIASGLVSHGCSDNPWGKDKSKEEPVFSNTFDSHCSSLGKYKLGERGYSSWGIHVKYLMHGLEPTNSNALKREIVLHGWDAIADHEVYPDGTPEGWGCPAVSNAFMKKLDELLQTRKKPVLLWVYE